MRGFYHSYSNSRNFYPKNDRIRYMLNYIVKDDLKDVPKEEVKQVEEASKEFENEVSSKYNLLKSKEPQTVKTQAKGGYSMSYKPLVNRRNIFVPIERKEPRQPEEVKNNSVNKPFTY